MSTRRWRGNAPLQAQVDTVTIYHVTAGVTYVLSNGGKSVSYTADDEDTLTTVMTELAALWNAAIEPQFTEITATAGVGVLTLTANNQGVPFDLTATQSGTGGNSEVKTVTIGNSPTGGTWDWVDSEYGTASGLAYNISDTSLTTALEVIYGSGNVTATGSSGGPFTVTFGGTLAHVNIPDTTFVATSLTGGNAAVSVVETRKGAAGTSEVQTITFYGSPAGGTWTASFMGVGTTPLAYNISSADLQTALRALTTIGATGVTVSGSAGGPYTVTFAGTLANTAVESIVVDTTSLTGGTIYATMATTTPGVDGVNEVQYLTQQTGYNDNDIFVINKTGTVSSGTFKITIGHDAGLVETADIPYDAKLYEIIDALEAAMLEGGNSGGPHFAARVSSRANQTVAEGEAFGGLVFQCIGNIGACDLYAISTDHDLESIAIDDASLVGGGSYVLSHSPGETTEVDLATDGSFTMSFGGQTTSALTLAVAGGSGVTSPTVAQVQSALEALSTIGTGSVSVSLMGGSGSARGAARSLFRIEFIGALAGTGVAQLTASSASVPTTGGLNTFPVYTLQNGVAGTSEVQSLTLSGTPSAGTFTLNYGGQTTSALAYNASAADVQAALVALDTVAAGEFTCSGGALPGTPVTITATGGLIYTDIEQIIVNDNGLKAIVVETTPGVTTTDEIQTISLTGSPFGGTATLTYNAHTTGTIAYNASAATVQAALEALSDFVPGDVVCAGGPWPAGITVTFEDAFAATDVAAITGSGASLNNGNVTSTSVDPIVYETTTANSGPNDISVAANWSGETLPVASDTVVVDQGDSPMLYHLDQLATGLAAFYHYSRYVGTIGLPEVNTDLGPYYEFRPQYLIVDAPIIRIGEGEGQGSGRIRIQGVVGTATTITVNGTATTEDDGFPALRLVLPNTSTVLNVNKGDVGVAVYPGETSTVATARVGYVTNVAGDSTVLFGSGVTLTTLEVSGGKVTTNSALTTVNMTDGELVHEAGAVTTINIDAGAVRYKATETLTTVVVGSGGNLDLSQDMRPVTITNIALHEGSAYADPHGRATTTNGIDFVRCQPADVEFIVVPNKTWTPSSI